jgi:acetyl esterase/lipase
VNPIEAPAPQSSGISVIHDIPYAEIPGLTLYLDLYKPTAGGRLPMVVYIHGGSWLSGTRKKCPVWLISKGYAVASIEYRLSSQAVFPAQIFDCKGAVRWLRAHAAEYGYDASRMAVMGASAGGHLAVLLGTSGGEEKLEGDVGGNLDQSSRVQAIVDFFGPTDFILRSTGQPDKTENPDGNVYRLLGHAVRADEERAKLASGAWHVTADAPPLIIVHGTQDDKVLLNQSQRLCEAYQEFGLENSLHLVEGAGHGGSAYEAPAIQELVTDFLEVHLKSTGVFAAPRTK